MLNSARGQSFSSAASSCTSCGADVALVGPRVHRDAVRAGLAARSVAARVTLGMPSVPRVAQQRDLVEVDRQRGARRRRRRRGRRGGSSSMQLPGLRISWRVRSIASAEMIVKQRAQLRLQLGQRAGAQPRAAAARSPPSSAACSARQRRAAEAARPRSSTRRDAGLGVRRVALLGRRAADASASRCRARAAGRSRAAAPARTRAAPPASPASSPRQQRQRRRRRRRTAAGADRARASSFISSSLQVEAGEQRRAASASACAAGPLGAAQGVHLGARRPRGWRPSVTQRAAAAAARRASCEVRLLGALGGQRDAARARA